MLLYEIIIVLISGSLCLLPAITIFHKSRSSPIKEMKLLGLSWALVVGYFIFILPSLILSTKDTLDPLGMQINP